MSEESPGASSYLVFISHSSQDRWIARQMARLIEERGHAHGIRTFLAESNIEVGDSIVDMIFQRIRECDEFVVLLSPHSINSRWVMQELGGARILEKRIISIIDKLELEELPEPATTRKAIDLNDFDLYLEQLIRRVQGVDL